MPRNITYNLKTRPTKAKPGRTDVIDTVTLKDGTVQAPTLIGKIQKVRGADSVTASVMQADGSRVALPGTFATRSQAGHACQRAFFGPAQAAAKAAKAQDIADAKAVKVAEKAQKAAEKAAAKAAA